jgi:tryptophan 7-halogenase
LKMQLFKHRGYVDAYKYGLFAPPSWISVFLGQGLEQVGCDPYVQNISEQTAKNKLRELSALIKKKVNLMPSHSDFIADYCQSKM